MGLKKNKKNVLGKSQVTRNKTVKETLEKQFKLGLITEIEFKDQCAKYEKSLIIKAAKYEKYFADKDAKKVKPKDFDLSKKKDKEKF